MEQTTECKELKIMGIAHQTRLLWEEFSDGSFNQYFILIDIDSLKNLERDNIFSISKRNSSDNFITMLEHRNLGFSYLLPNGISVNYLKELCQSVLDRAESLTEGFKVGLVNGLRFGVWFDENREEIDSNDYLSPSLDFWLLDGFSEELSKLEPELYNLASSDNIIEVMNNIGCNSWRAWGGNLIPNLLLEYYPISPNYDDLVFWNYGFAGEKINSKLIEANEHYCQ